jgi:hypothetical protein
LLSSLTIFSYMPSPLNRFPPPVAEEKKKSKNQEASLLTEARYTHLLKKKLLRMKYCSWFWVEFFCLLQCCIWSFLHLLQGKQIRVNIYWLEEGRVRDRKRGKTCVRHWFSLMLVQFLSTKSLSCSQNSHRTVTERLMG